MSDEELHDLIMRTLCRVEMGEGYDDSRFGWRHHADALMAELAALRADAMRYRWLRQMIYDDRIIVAPDRMLHGPELDAAIDAMQAAP